MTTRSNIDKQIAKGELSKYGIGKQAPAPVQDDLDIPDFLRRDKPQEKSKYSRGVPRRIGRPIDELYSRRQLSEQPFKKLSAVEVEVSDLDLNIIAKEVQTVLGDKLEAYNIIYMDGKAAGLFHEIIKGFILNECKHLDDKVYRYIVKGE